MDLLKKIKSLTTKTGIYQHGKLDKPDPKFGYAIEDQARALIIVSELKEKKLQKIYLDFILNAKRADGLLYHFYYENKKNGLFVNNEHDSKPNTKEAYGIILWSLLKTQIKDKNVNDKTQNIIKNLIKDAYRWTSPRAISAALLGLTNLDLPDRLENILKEKLHNLYLNTSAGNWEWFENYLVYANAIIPWSLWEVYIRRGDRASFEIAKKTTGFLINTCQENNFPAPIGNKGWYFKGGNKAIYDQQPIDSSYMVCCLEKAYLATGSKFYLNWAKKWYEWFDGNNINNIPLVDDNLACYDALSKNGVNLNQGAESNICFVMAHLAARRLNLIR